jgi:acetyl-CoA carboxylase biotin carboxyl carrier protein
MQIKEIEELIRLIERSQIEEFELERAGTRILIKKANSAAPSTATPPPAAAGVVGSAEQAEGVGIQLQEGVEPDEPLHVFTAPIVGTFYLTPKPDADPLVEPGSPVQTGQVICIIEAMKIFNQIESDVEGELVRILVENGQPVEYGEVLFEIRLSSQSDVQEDSSSESR